MRTKTSEFVEELKALDPRVSVIQNPNYPQLLNVKILGQDVSPMPSDEISDVPDQTHRFEFPNGMNPRHKCKEEVLGQVKSTLERLDSSPEFLKEFTAEA